MFKSWCLRIGQGNFEKEFKKWSESPCNNDLVLNEGWKVWDYQTYQEYHGTAKYNAETQYHAGDRVIYNYGAFEATTDVIGVVPARVFAFRDSFYRVVNWIYNRIALEDVYYGFSE